MPCCQSLSFRIALLPAQLIAHLAPGMPPLTMEVLSGVVTVRRALIPTTKRLHTNLLLLKLLLLQLPLLLLLLRLLLLHRLGLCLLLHRLPLLLLLGRLLLDRLLLLLGRLLFLLLRDLDHAFLNRLTLGRASLLGLVLLLLLPAPLVHLLDGLLHDLDVFPRRGALREEGQALLHLVAQLLAEDCGRLLGEVVDARGEGALVREVPGDAPLVLLLCTADEGGVEDEAVLGGVALRLQRAEERLLGPEDLHCRGRVLCEVREASGVRDEPGADDLADQGAEVGGDQVHLRLQVLVQALAHARELDDLVCKVVDVLHVHLHDVLTHGHPQRLQNVVRHLLCAAGLHELLLALVGGEGAPHADHAGDLCVGDVVCHDLRQLRKVPGVPLADAHREGIDVLVQVVEQGDRVDDRLVLAVGVELHPAAAEAVAQTKPCLVEVQLVEVLDKPREV
mmetsp:Transcript_38696/g.120385  ORF Transcript_38696/g.120385 Transcript_38696/m.120385 type:complete len:450 (-) Transcript_38696:449-1798(-)